MYKTFLNIGDGTVAVMPRYGLIWPAYSIKHINLKKGVPLNGIRDSEKWTVAHAN